MKKLELSDIRLESILTLLDCLSAHGELSPRGISERTGLSLMTVGKLCDGLEERGIITRRKSDGGSAGRKAALMRLDPARRFVICDLSVEPARLYVTDQSGRERFSREFTDETYEEVFSEAFMQTMLDDGELAMTGLILPHSDLSGAAKRYRELTGSSADVIETSVRASALGHGIAGSDASSLSDGIADSGDGSPSDSDGGSPSDSDEGLILHVRVGRSGELEAALLDGGELYDGAHRNEARFDRLVELTGSIPSAIRAAVLCFDPALLRLEVADEQLYGEIFDRLADMGLTIERVRSGRSSELIGIARLLRARSVALRAEE